MGRGPQAFLMSKTGQLVTTERYLREKEYGVGNSAPVTEADPKLINEKTGEVESIEERSARMGTEAEERRGKLAEETQTPAQKNKENVSKAVEKLADAEKTSSEDTYKEELIAKARAMGLSVAANRAVKTIEGKIAEAEKKQS